ncbi:MAG: ribonuclease R [Clostridiales bacterium]|nr:ribonuclease R [Clostridiales bacterium]
MARRKKNSLHSRKFGPGMQRRGNPRSFSKNTLRDRTPRQVSAAPEAPVNYAEVAPRGPAAVKNTVIGILRPKGNGGEVIPGASFKETDFGPVSIYSKDINGAPFGMTVVCEILNPYAHKGQFRGKIIEVLGDYGNTNVRMMEVVRRYGLKTDFPDEVKTEIEPLAISLSDEEVDAAIKAGRRDLRDLLTITIDGEDAKDLDDAITLERLPNGNWHLYVHIADVSNYVREGTALDEEAFIRGTSVYLADRVLPMLPAKLSNGICSLNPNVARFTMTCEMELDNDGHAVKSDIYESVIVSDRRMSYNECYRILTEPADDDLNEYGKIVGMLTDMKVLAEILKRMREMRGAINFNFPETKVLLDDEGNPTEVMAYPINFCHGIIESFMIAANECVAETFAKLQYPFVYRVHDDPDPIKIAGFNMVARHLGIPGRIPSEAKPLDIACFMANAYDNPRRELLEELLLRSMAKAVYDSINFGHFGLASKFYCHFTSPIRRYPDLYIHRIIKSYLRGEDKKSHFGGKVSNVAAHSSDMERNAAEAERASVQVKVCEYMNGKIGEVFEGRISGIITSGLFVRLPNTIEGFVAFRTLPDHYIFDERRYCATSSKKTFNIGDDVKVELVNVDMDSDRIDFEIVS